MFCLCLSYWNASVGKRGYFNDCVHFGLRSNFQFWINRTLCYDMVRTVHSLMKYKLYVWRIRWFIHKGFLVLKKRDQNQFANHGHWTGTCSVCVCLCVFSFNSIIQIDWYWLSQWMNRPTGDYPLSIRYTCECWQFPSKLIIIIVIIIIVMMKSFFLFLSSDLFNEHSWYINSIRWTVKLNLLMFARLLIHSRGSNAVRRFYSFFVAFFYFIGTCKVFKI